MLRHSLTSLAETCHTDQRMLAGFDDTDDPATTPPSQLVKLRGFNCTGNLSASEHKRLYQRWYLLPTLVQHATAHLSPRTYSMCFECVNCLSEYEYVPTLVSTTVPL